MAQFFESRHSQQVCRTDTWDTHAFYIPFASCVSNKVEVMRKVYLRGHAKAPGRNSASAVCDIEAPSLQPPPQPTTARPHTMQSLRRTAVTATRQGRTTLPRQPRRFAHDEHAHGHGHEPVNEPIGVRSTPLPPSRCAGEPMQDIRKGI